MNKCLWVELLVVDANVFAVVVLFPNGYFVVTSRHSQHVARQGPAHMPSGTIELMESSRLPHAQRIATRVVQVARPNDHLASLSFIKQNV